MVHNDTFDKIEPPLRLSWAEPCEGAVDTLTTCQCVSSLLAVQHTLVSQMMISWQLIPRPHTRPPMRVLCGKKRWSPFYFYLTGACLLVWPYNACSWWFLDHFLLSVWLSLWIYTNGGVHSVPSENVREREIQSCELVCVCMWVNSGMCFLLRLDCTAMDVINVL